MAVSLLIVEGMEERSLHFYGKFVARVRANVSTLTHSPAGAAKGVADIACKLFQARSLSMADDTAEFDPSLLILRRHTAKMWKTSMDQMRARCFIRDLELRTVVSSWIRLGDAIQADLYNAPGDTDTNC